MAKLFTAERTVRLRRERKLTAGKYYQVVATKESDLSNGNWFIDLDPFPHFAFYPDPNNLWSKLTEYGVNHIYFRLLLSFSNPSVRKMTAMYFSNQDYRIWLEERVKSDLSKKKMSPEVYLYNSIKNNYYSSVLGRIMRGRKIMGLFGNTPEAVKSALSEDVSLKNIILSVSVKLSNQLFSEKILSDDYKKIHTALVKEAISRKTSFKNFSLTVDTYEPARPQEMLAPSTYDINERKKRMAKHYQIAQGLSDVIQRGELAKFMEKEGTQAITIPQKRGKFTITHIPNKRNIDHILARMGFSFRDSEEVWELITTNWGLLPNPLK